jgi:hypothetical protein
MGGEAKRRAEAIARGEEDPGLKGRKHLNRTAQKTLDQFTSDVEKLKRERLLREQRSK